MLRLITVMGILTVPGLIGTTASSQPRPGAELQLLISEVQPGVMASEQYCLLVFEDRSFHAEKASLKLGKDRDRKIYEQKLSEADWDALSEILNNRELREIKLSPGAVPPIVPDAHSYVISVARGHALQNMEFVDSKSMKPYESQLKPLLRWWKAVRNRRLPQSESSPDARCGLDSIHGLFSY